MTEIDDRIVSMKFDNAAFESKLATTIQSLDRLRQSLDFANSKRSLEDLSAAGSRFTMGGMGNVVEGISGKFLSLATIGVTALSTITRQAVMAGEQLVKSMTIAPISAGFAEYEQGLTAFQTIVANTKTSGTTVEQVNKALAELNEYANKTIYSFGDMTKAVGLFTAQGVNLSDSLTGIKGIFNIVSLTGGNAEKANSAIYQLSQAIASGTVKAQDWISVVNAGIGGTDFQNALKQTARTHGVAVDDMIKKNGSFKDSLQEGWLSSKILLETLNQYTGDMSVQQLKSMGYTDEQAKKIIELGKTAQDSATRIKSYTQLMDTLKSNVVTGWATTFKTIVGNLDEASVLWTTVGNGFGGMLQASSDARNKLVSDWKSLGGRDILFQGLKDAVAGVGSVLKPIRDAFREIFPPATAAGLLDLTKRFGEFAKGLKIGADTADKIKEVFRGFFSIFAIGKEIFSSFIYFIREVLNALAPAGSGLLGFAASGGEMLNTLRQSLVEGGGIFRFFESLAAVVQHPINFIKALGESIGRFFGLIKAPDLEGVSKGVSNFFDTFKKLDPKTTDSMDGGFKRLGDRLSWFGEVLSKIGEAIGWFWDKLSSAANFIKNSLGSLFDFLSNLGPNIAKALDSKELQSIIQLLNTLFLALTAGAVKKLATNGLGLNFNLGGDFMTKFTEVAKDFHKTFKSFQVNLDTLTGSLKALQTNVKSKTLLNIAIALGILTASVLVLSMIDPKALGTALGAMAVGFGELVGAMAVLDKASSGIASGPKIAAISAGLILLASAMAILAVAMKIFSTMSWEDIGKGLAGIGGALLLIAGAMQLMPSGPAMIAQSTGLVAIGVALNLIAVSMKIFATMSWEDIGKGLAGLGAGLLLIAGAMQLMPSGVGMVLQSEGLIAIGIALNLIAASMKIFATMSWEDIGKGLAGIGGGLLLIAGAMQLMPINLPITASGILILSVALNIMALAVKSLGSNDWQTLAKGLGAMAGMLLILVVAMNNMEGTIRGAIALGIVAAALVVLAEVIEKLGSLKISEILTGLGAIAGALLILGVAGYALGPLVPALIGLGIALGLVGASFALFGVGAMLIVKSMEVMAKLGTAAAKAFVSGLEIIIKAIPEIAAAAALFVVKFGENLLSAAPELIQIVTDLLTKILDTIIVLVPKIAEALGMIISEGLTLIREKIPEFIATGFEMLMALLQGIRDNIEEISTLGFEIITQFVNSLIVNMPELVASAAKLIVSFLTELANHAAEMVAAGAELLVEFLRGISDNVGQVITAGADVIVAIIQGFSDNIQKVIDAGANLIIKFIEGIASNTLKVLEAAAQTLIDFLNGLAEAIRTYTPQIEQAGLNVILAIISGMTGGLTDHMGEVISWFTGFGGKVIGWVGDLLGTLKQKGMDLVQGLLNGISEMFSTVMTWFGGIGKALQDGIVEPLKILYNIGKDILTGLWDGIWSLKDWIIGKFGDLVGWLPGWAKDFLGIGSPSKVFRDIGIDVIKGFVWGLNDKAQRDQHKKAMESLANSVIENFNPDYKKIKKMKFGFDSILNDLGKMDNFKPTITPVLDLTHVKRGSRDIQKYLDMEPIRPKVSMEQANIISLTNDLARTTAKDQAAANIDSRTIKFEQTINSPLALSTNDIYRNTKSQIAMAKEELKIS